MNRKTDWSHWLRTACAVLATTLFATSAAAQSFSLDDNPLAAGGFGKGAEDEFGLAGGAPSLAPSPSLAFTIGGDGALISPAIGGAEQMPNGFYIDAFSTNHFRPGLENFSSILLHFSVDRLTPGLPGSASAAQFALGQQPGDIFTSTSRFINPVAFLGTLGPGPFAGPLASAGIGGTNTLTIDESAFGLTTAAGIVGPAAPGGLITPGSHDNVDAFDFDSILPIAPVYAKHSYFAIAPDEAAAVTTVSAADIFDTAPLTPGTSPIPYATAVSMGLDTMGMNTDSIDGLVVFDSGLLGGPANGGPGAEPFRDFALFSLAPGSASLSTFGLSASDVFFTDFSGAFGVFAFPTDLGLFPGAPGFPFQNQSNIDALEITIPEPTSLLLLGLATLGLCANRSRSRQK